VLVMLFKMGVRSLRTKLQAANKTKSATGADVA
jgi:hypothetical protein